MGFWKPRTPNWDIDVGKAPLFLFFPFSPLFFFLVLENVDLILHCFSFTNTEGQTLPQLLEMSSERCTWGSRDLGPSGEDAGKK